MNRDIQDLIKANLPMLIMASATASPEKLNILLIPIIIMILSQLITHLYEKYFIPKMDSLSDFKSKKMMILSGDNIRTTYIVIDFMNYITIFEQKLVKNIMDFGGHTSIMPSENIYQLTNENILKPGQIVKFKIVVEKQDRDNISSIYLILYAKTLTEIDEVMKECQGIYRKYVRDKNWVLTITNKFTSSPDKVSTVFVNKTLDNIYLSAENDNKIRENIESFKNSENFYHERGVPYKSGILLHGAPGCGKSSFIFALANTLKKQIIKINISTMTNPEFEDACNGLEDVIVVFEDIDAHKIVHKRTLNKSEDFVIIAPEEQKDGLSKNLVSNKSPLTFDTILAAFDGYTAFRKCYIILTTNHIDVLDPALIRPGRVDLQIEFKMCDRYQLSRIFEDYTGQKLPDSVKFTEYKYSTSYIINMIILPNYKNVNKIIEMLD